MYIRFVTSEYSEESNQKLGVFHAIRYLHDDGELSSDEFSAADVLMTWFASNLESPLEHLNKQRSKESDIYISWFKDHATVHIEKARDLSRILKEKDVEVEMLKTSRPGKIVYEDEYQIFAKPYSVF